MAVCVLVLLLLSLSIGLVKAERGQSVTSLLGEDVTLSCSPNPDYPFPSMLTEVQCITNSHFIYWRKIDDTPSTDITYCLSFYEDNYSKNRVTVDYSDNTYNLHISNVQPSDEGQYQCFTYHTSTEIAINVQLNIYEHSCSANSQAIEIGDHVSLKCSLQILRALQWIAPNGTVIASRSDQSNKQMVFNFTAREEHSFETFTCVAISESDTYNPECEVTPLEHTFITISPQISRVNQGDNATFTCATRLGLRKPHKYNYAWLQDDNIVLQGLNMSLYIVHDLQLSDNGAQVQCKASNDGGEEMESGEAIIYVSAIMTTPNPDDARRTRNDGDLLTSKRSKYIPGPPDTREGSTTTTNVGIIVGCVGGTVLLLIISVILVLFIKKKKTRKSTGEVESATTLTRGHDSTSGTSKGRDPSKAPTPGVTNQSSPAKNENDAVYALPQQKDGGHTTASSDSGELATVGQSGIAATIDDVDATYAEPNQDDGITYGNVTDSRDLEESQESQPNVEGLLYAELEITKSNANDGQIINTTEATIYAAIQQVQ